MFFIGKFNKKYVNFWDQGDFRLFKDRTSFYSRSKKCIITLLKILTNKNQSHFRTLFALVSITFSFGENSNFGQESLLEVLRQNIAGQGHGQLTFKSKKFICHGISLSCFGVMRMVNSHTYLNINQRLVNWIIL